MSTARELALNGGDRGGYLNAEQVAIIAGDDATRLTLLVCRFHEGRLLVPAQDCQALLAALEVAGWTLRDVAVTRAGGQA